MDLPALHAFVEHSKARRSVWERNLSPHSHQIVIKWISIHVATTTGTYAASKNRSLNIFLAITAHQTSVHDTFVEAGGINADADGVPISIDKVVALEAAHHGRAVLECTLIVACAGILLGNSIDVFLRSLLDGIDW